MKNAWEMQLIQELKQKKKKTTTRTIKDKYNDNVAAIFDIEPANVAVVQLLLLLLLHSY